MKKRTEQILLLRLAAQRGIKDSGQMVDVVRYKIRQLAVFAVVPDLLHRVQLRCIGRQPLNLNTAKPFLQSFGTATMNHPAINHKDYTFREMHKQPGNKIFEIIGTNIGILYRKIQAQILSFRRDADSRYCRQPVTPVPTVMNRCLSLWCPCPPDGRLQHKAAFIDKYDGFTRPAGFFLYEANRPYARWQWYFHHALWLFSRVFGNSSPCLSKYARRLSCHRRYRSAFQSLRRLVAGSIVQCDSRSCGHLSTAVFLTSACAFDLAPAVVPADCGPQRMLRLVFHRLAAIGLWLRVLRQRVLPSHLRDGLVGAKQWLFAAYVPVGQLFLWVAYPYYRQKTVHLFNFSKSNKNHPYKRSCS